MLVVNEEDMTAGGDCDRCPAKALLVVALGDTNGDMIGVPLKFCGHHGNLYSDVLFTKFNVIATLDSRKHFVLQERTRNQRASRLQADWQNTDQ